MDVCGYARGRPAYADLFGKYILSRLSEPEPGGEVNVLSAPFNVSQLCSSEFLSLFGEFAGNDIMQRFGDYKKQTYEVTPETIIGQNERVQQLN